VEIIKPIMDRVAAATILILTFPITFPVFLLLLIANQGNAFFTQRRPGKDGKIFTILKFKTMNDKTDQFGNLLADDERLTKVGQFVRKTSLDEIPQLLNVFAGDMSIVGPRPLLVEYLPIYSDFQAKRHKVKPGITGWAQVNGRNSISWPKKFELDVWYINHISFWLDMQILFLTFLKVFKSEGISSKTSFTMEKFTGKEIEKENGE